MKVLIAKRNRFDYENWWDCLTLSHRVVIGLNCCLAFEFNLKGISVTTQEKAGKLLKGLPHAPYLNSESPVQARHRVP